MRHQLFVVVLTLVLASSGSSILASESPRYYVHGVAQAIEENYFDEARADRIASELRSAAAQGEFDQLTDQRELASALTLKLEKFDQHFRVDWSDSQAPAVDSGPVSPQRQSPDEPRRRNYGVRHAEVLTGNVGYLDVRAFAPFEFGVDQQPARLIIDAALLLLSGTDALIIDLRDNGGGAPQMVGYLSSAFVKKDADIFNTFQGRGRTMSEAPLDWYAQPRLDTPLYILISARTASAAEAFAYTMQSAKRATIVGEASMGAANPGGDVDAGNGFSVFVSFATPINPITKTNWEGKGVSPDVVVAPAMALQEARQRALSALLSRGLPEPSATDTRWALEVLQAENAAPRRVSVGDYTGTFGPMAIAPGKDRLILKQGRRPVRTLWPVGTDTFALLENPSQRAVFQRSAEGRIVALELQHSDGKVARHPRNE